MLNFIIVILISSTILIPVQATFTPADYTANQLTDYTLEINDVK